MIHLGLHAATLVLKRKGDEFLWVRRGETAPFLAGYWALPGGMVSGVDSAVDPATREESVDLDLALRRAALREAREEVGLPELPPPLQRDLERALSYEGSWRTHEYIPKSIEGHTFTLDLTQHPDLYQALIKQLNDPLAPESSRKSALTLFNTPNDHPLTLPVDGFGRSELSDARWLRADQVEARWSEGEMILAPPTLALCRVAARGQALSEARVRSPELAHLNQVNPEVQLLPLRTPTLPPATHTNCYLVGRDSFVVIDPGPSDPKKLEPLCHEIDARLARGHELRGVLITHSHADHTGGVASLLSRYSTRLIGHADAVWRWRERVSQSTPTLGSDDRVELIGEGDVLTLTPHHKKSSSRDQWRVLHTPGHAPGHLCLINDQTKTAIVGDMVAGVGTILIDPDDGDLGEYLAQLTRLDHETLGCLLPSHGPPIATPHVTLRHYLKHRRAREVKIWRALPRARVIAEGGGEVPWIKLGELVDRAYADAPPIARSGRDGGIAGRSALSHLLHLQTRGHALCSDPTPKLSSRWIALGEGEWIGSEVYDGSEIEEKLSRVTRRQRGDDLAQAARRLDAMMTTLRVQCPWDRRQTLESLQRYLIEESYEVLDALRSGASPELHRDELGDLLFQVVFQSKIREQEGAFDLADVMNALAAKLSRRHPHIFGPLDAQTPEDAKAIWHQVKAEERAQRAAAEVSDSREGARANVTSVLESIPSAAPALLRAEMIGDRAASVGFDWPSVEGSLEKVDEERVEVADAIAQGDPDEMLAELGDLLFAVVNVCRHLKVSPETALERTNQTFTRRFQGVEQLAVERGLTLNELSIDELEGLWREVKAQHAR